jgi:adenosylcobinamide-phosphate synthase
MSRPARWPLAAGLAAGVALDALLGDPRRFHPVAAFGRAAAALESRDYADSRLRGAAHAAACVLAVAVPAALLHRRTRGWPPSEAVAAALAVWAVTGARSLHHEAERAMVALARNDPPAARRVLPSLCGRDPAGLDATQITRAVIESVAENTSDALVAPLLWGAVGGLPGLAAYRAVNTLDAMVGYRSPRYLRYGWASARLDDVANWVPARVTAALTVACAAVTGPVHASASALRAVLRDGSRHPSPNAGQCEAAFAGALGLRLGGTNVYGGVAEVRPELGEGRAPEPDDIRRAIRLSRAVTVAATGLAVLIAVFSPARLRALLTRLLPSSLVPRSSVQSVARPSARGAPSSTSIVPGLLRSLRRPLSYPADSRKHAAGRRSSLQPCEGRCWWPGPDRTRARARWSRGCAGGWPGRASRWRRSRRRTCR